MKILIAEDDNVSRLVLASTLRKQGHEVVAAEDGLKLRTELADLFTNGDYAPLELHGPHRDHFIAYARRQGRNAAVVVVQVRQVHRIADRGVDPSYGASAPGRFARSSRRRDLLSGLPVRRCRGGTADPRSQ